VNLVEFSEVLDGSYHLAGIGVFVVIPGNNLYLIGIVVDLSNHGLGSIEERTVADTDDVGRNDSVFVVTEGLGRSSLHSSVDTFNGDVLTLNNCNENGGGTGAGGNTLSGTDELLVEFGDYKTDSLSSAGGVGNDVLSAGTCTTEVTLSVGTVKDHLVAGVSVNGGHDTALNGSVIVKSLSHGSEAVGGTGCCRDDLIFSGKSLLVNGVNDGLEIAACGSRDNDLLSACIDVSLRLFERAVETGTLENNVYAKLAPGAVVSVFFSIDLKGLAVYGNGTCFIVSGNGVTVVTTLSGIVFEKMSKHGGAGKVVYSNDLVAFCTEHLSEGKTADTAEAINSNSN